MAADNPTSGTDTHVETVEKPQAADRPSSPPPDKPGAEGAPSRAESRAATTAAREAPRETGAEQRGEREDKPAPQAPAESAGEKRDTATASKPETEGPEQRDAPRKDGRTSEGSSQPTDSSVSDSRGEHDRPATQSETREPDVQRPEAETSTADQKRSTEVEDRGRSGDQEPARATADGGQEPERTNDSGGRMPSPETRVPGGQTEKVEGNSKPPEVNEEVPGESESTQPDRSRDGEHSQVKSKEGNSSPERTPAGGSDKPTNEFDARQESREATQGNGAESERTLETGKSGSGSAKLEEGAVKGNIDPFAPDRGKAEGQKEPFDRTIRSSDAEWTGGVDRFGDLPTGEALAEGDENQDRDDKFRQAAYKNYSDIHDRVKAIGKTIDQAFGTRPTGHAETRVDGPTMAEPHHSGIDAGSTASALLTLGVVGAEAGRRVLSRIREWRGNEGNR
ncbi:hypothetical protein F8568_040385 [Actinomadura sp. LD22]|uniref:Uncharacterized protein n=1 Tax=Actinomadura physcomitrii TaxID=2650748 RepID=A0A6I4MR97_9ACTN|nr:hypothetical protein [Actinomadura physcomitrii]MWA06504.1 hypothetical protein [Actinomadura physcomitrii]